tara:strand:+ start:19464 stop:19892 length:429 start_codon:yes stop_codon:yes gene_type:complete
MRVIEIAKQLGVTVDTVRFYTRINILKPTKDKTNGYRDYNDKDFNRLRFVLNARQLGFSVDDIKHILTHADNKTSPCPDLMRLIDRRLHEAEQRFAEALQLRERMLQTVLEWSEKSDKVSTDNMIFRLVEDFVLQTAVKNNL